MERSISGLILNACSVRTARVANTPPKGWQRCRQLGDTGSGEDSKHNPECDMTVETHPWQRTTGMRYPATESSYCTVSVTGTEFTVVLSVAVTMMLL